MTFLRRDPDNISNHFDELLKGVAPRGISFMDIDGLSHDGMTRRFLMMEFKHAGERLNDKVEWALTDFARMPNCRAVAIWWMGDDDYNVVIYPERINQDHLCERAIRSMIKDWWDQARYQVEAR